MGQCEIDDYGTKVLEKNFPGVERWRDIRDVTDESVRERIGIGTGELTLLSGGFPCQPHSVAGKRKASADERDLWGEFARVIREIRPKWVLGENVRGLLSSENGRFFGRILRDMDEMGYHVGWCCYGASEVGALHRRERVFIIAHAAGERRNSLDEIEKIRRSMLNNQGTIWNTPKTYREFENNILSSISRTFTIPKRGVLRNDDGLSAGLDRLKCLGNAVCPQQIYPILEQIAEIERVLDNER